MLDLKPRVHRLLKIYSLPWHGIYGVGHWTWAGLMVSIVSIATGLPTAILAAEPALEKPITWAEEFRPIYPSRASYPRVAQLADGTLLATFAHSTPGKRAIGCVSSRDGGRTWGNYRQVLDQNRPVDLDNAFPLQLADGTILAAYRRHTSGTYRIEVHASVDGGDHWALRGTIATGHDGLWEPFLLLIPSGVVQAYYASEEVANRTGIEMRKFLGRRQDLGFTRYRRPEKGFKRWDAGRGPIGQRGTPSRVRGPGRFALSVCHSRCSIQRQWTDLGRDQGVDLPAQKSGCESVGRWCPVDYSSAR